MAIPIVVLREVHVSKLEVDPEENELSVKIRCRMTTTEEFSELLKLAKLASMQFIALPLQSSLDSAGKMKEVQMALDDALKSAVLGDAIKGKE